MTDDYNGETLVLPDIGRDTGMLPHSEMYLFAVHDGRIERFPLNGVMRLGRMTEDNVPEIAIQNMFLSRSHGYFTVADGKVSYTAEKTTNGISLNGKPVDAGSTVALSDGDELSVRSDRHSAKDKDILLKCAFSPRNISLWSSMTEAQLDELTGLPGRRLFSDRFRTYHRSDDSEDRLFMLDIDKFKQINDVYGHSAGDEALKVLSSELSKPSYNITSPTRWGGDEFVGIISGSRECVMNNMDILLDSLSAKLIKNSFFICVSLGLCVIPRDKGAEQFPTLLEKADKALYRAKKSETERIIFYEDIANEDE